MQQTESEISQTVYFCALYLGPVLLSVLGEIRRRARVRHALCNQVFPLNIYYISFDWIFVTRTV